MTPTQAVMYDIYILDTIFSFLSSTDIVSVGRTCRTALEAKRSYLRRAKNDASERRLSLFFPRLAAFLKAKSKFRASFQRERRSFDDAYRSNTFHLIVYRGRLYDFARFLERAGYTFRSTSPGQTLEQAVRRMNRDPIRFLEEGGTDFWPCRVLFGYIYFDKVVNNETLTVVLNGVSVFTEANWVRPNACSHKARQYYAV